MEPALVHPRADGQVAVPRRHSAIADATAVLAIRDDGLPPRPPRDSHWTATSRRPTKCHGRVLRGDGPRPAAARRRAAIADAHAKVAVEPDLVAQLGLMGETAPSVPFEAARSAFASGDLGSRSRAPRRRPRSWGGPGGRPGADRVGAIVLLALVVLLVFVVLVAAAAWPAPDRRRAGSAAFLAMDARFAPGSAERSGPSGTLGPIRQRPLRRSAEPLRTPTEAHPTLMVVRRTRPSARSSRANRPTLFRTSRPDPGARGPRPRRDMEVFPRREGLRAASTRSRTCWPTPSPPRIPRRPRSRRWRTVMPSPRRRSSSGSPLGIARSACTRPPSWACSPSRRAGPRRPGSA